ncbi:hypothetical protein BTL46_02500 [Bordetella holmesii]|nr:hypothetical protein BTL46_02500 [Bordetella holmesii]AUL31787.1 hypothetical protein BTL51_02515 [Bordetella holmesii]
MRIADCGLRIADCGLRIADCGLRIADCGLRIAWFFHCCLTVGQSSMAAAGFGNSGKASLNPRPQGRPPRVESDAAASA